MLVIRELRLRRDHPGKDRSAARLPACRRLLGSPEDARPDRGISCPRQNFPRVRDVLRVWKTHVKQTRSKSPLELARTAMAEAREAIPQYSSRFSRHDYTQHQLYALVALRRLLKTDYRGLEATLRDWTELRETLGLSHVPDHSTIQRAARRLKGKGKPIRRRGARPGGADAPVRPGGRFPGLRERGLIRIGSTKRPSMARTARLTTGPFAFSKPARFEAAALRSP